VALDGTYIDFDLSRKGNVYEETQERPRASFVCKGVPICNPRTLTVRLSASRKHNNGLSLVTRMAWR